MKIILKTGLAALAAVVVAIAVDPAPMSTFNSFEIFDFKAAAICFVLCWASDLWFLLKRNLHRLVSRIQAPKFNRKEDQLSYDCLSTVINKMGENPVILAHSFVNLQHMREEIKNPDLRKLLDRWERLLLNGSLREMRTAIRSSDMRQNCPLVPLTENIKICAETDS